MITGAHVIVYSRDADADRAFVRDVLGFPYVDAGGGWLIFALPPAEAAVHPTETEPGQQLYLLCDDIEAQVRELRSRGVEIAREPAEQRWGIVAAIRLPSGAELEIYEPRHPSPLQPSV